MDLAVNLVLLTAILSAVSHSFLLGNSVTMSEIWYTCDNFVNLPNNNISNNES